MNKITTGKDKGRVLRWLRDNWPRIEGQNLTQSEAARLASEELQLDVSLSRFDHIRSLLIGMGHDEFAVWPTRRGRSLAGKVTAGGDSTALATAIRNLYDVLGCSLTDLGQTGDRIIQLSEQD